MMMVYCDGDNGIFEMHSDSYSDATELIADLLMIIRHAYEEVDEKDTFIEIMVISILSGVVFQTKEGLCDLAERRAMDNIHSKEAQRLLEESFELRRCLDNEN